MIQPMHRALARQCEVVDVPATDLGVSVADRFLARASGALGRAYLPGHAIATAIRQGRILDRRLSWVDADVVLAVVASQQTAFLRTRIPLVALSDATFPLLLDFYPAYHSLPAPSRMQGRIVERRAWRQASRRIVTTTWARDSLVHDYGISPSSCHVIPLGPGIAPVSSRHETRTPHDPLRLLAVIRDWDRKQGDLVLKAVQFARANGASATLTVVGPVPTNRSRDSDAQFLGALSPEELSGVYADHDVLIDLAHANCSSVTLTDAAAFGLPSNATAIGGVQDLVDSGTTGFLVPMGSNMASIVAVRISQLADPATYARMSAAAIEKHRDVMNWERWAADLLEVCNLATWAGPE